MKSSLAYFTPKAIPRSQVRKVHRRHAYIAEQSFTCQACRTTVHLGDWCFPGLCLSCGALRSNSNGSG